MILCDDFVEEGNKVSNLFAGGHHEFSELLTDMKLNSDKLDSAIGDYFKLGSSNETSFETLIEASASFAKNSKNASRTVGIVKDQLAKFSTSTTTLSSTFEEVEKQVVELESRVNQARLSLAKRMLNSGMMMMKTVKKPEKRYLQELSVVKASLIDNIKNIFLSSQDINKDDGDKELLLFNIAASYQQVVDKLHSTVSVDGADELIIKLGDILLTVVEDVESGGAGDSRGVADVCAKLLTAVSEAAKKSQVVTEVVKELLLQTRDLETSILFASAGTWNTEDGAAFSDVKDDILSGTKNLSQHVQDIVTATSAGSREDLTTVAEKILKLTPKLVEDVKTGAGALSGDNQSGQVLFDSNIFLLFNVSVLFQILLLNTVKGAASSLQDLLNQAKTASEQSDPRLVEAVREKARVINVSVSCLMFCVSLSHKCLFLVLN